MPTLQYFALDSTATGYAAAIADLASKTSTNRGYTVTQVLRAASHDANIKIICAYVDESDLTGDTAGLHSDNYPSELCRHRWDTRHRFRLSGFHMLGESVRSYEGVSGRTARHIRPQQGITDSTGGGGGQDYGAGDGTTDYDAFNGPQDPAIADGGVTDSAMHQTGHSYFIKGGAHTRWGTFANGGNIDFPGENGGAGQGSIAVEDATGLGAAGEIVVYFEGDSPLGPGMFWGTYLLWPRNQQLGVVTLPWEEYDNGIYVNGYFQSSGSSGTSVSNAQYGWDADIDDITVNMETLLQRHLLKGKTLLSDLSGTGGRGRFHAQHSAGGGDEDFTAVLFNDGAGNWTDLTTAANSATTDDFELMPASAANGAYIAFISDVPYSVISLNLSQVQVGGTLECVYSQGSSTFGAFTGIDDQSSGLTSGTAVQVVAFNPKSDWATDTFASGESFEVTGYAVIFRKTGGTVTQAARGDQVRRRRRAVYVHRWDDGAPTLGMCTGGASGNFENGFRYRTESKGNIRFVGGRFATGGAEFFPAWSDAQITYETCQIVPFTQLVFQSGNDGDLTFTTADWEACWWAVDDHIVQSPTDAVFTSTQYGLVGYHDDDPSYYSDIKQWTDITYMPEGLQKNGGNPTFTISGCKLRNSAVEVQGMNDVIRDFLNAGVGDNHILAGRNNQDWANDTIEKFGIENFLSIELYAAGEGNDDAPVNGSGSNQRNIALRHGYITTWNGRVDTGQPGRLIFSGDPDRGRYADGTGLSDGCEIEYVLFQDLNYSDTNQGVCIIYTMDGPITVNRVSAVNCNWLWRLSKGREHSAFTFVYDESEDTYTEVTDNLKASGDTNTNMFPDTPAAGDMFVVAMVSAMGETQRRAKLTFATPASMGTAVVSVVYRKNDATWAAASNVSGLDLTQNTTITFDRPTDAGTVTISAVEYYALAIRLDSGAFATAPVLNEVRGRIDGAGMSISNFVVVEPIAGVGKHTAGDPTINGSFIQESNGVIHLGAGQDENTDLYRWSSADGAAHLTLAEWQALSKSKTNTDALEDSVFGSSVTIA